MAAKKKIEDEQLMKFFEAFYYGECEGDPDYFSIPRFGIYVREQPGYEDVNDYLLRRCKPLRARMEKLHGTEEESLPKIAVFKPLDVHTFLAKNNTRESLIRALTNLDGYYKRVAASAGYSIKKYNEQVEEVMRIKRTMREMEEDNKRLEETLEEEKKRRITAEKKAKKLASYIDDYVNPGIANTLLVEDREMKDAVTVIDSDKFDDNLITADADINADSIIDELMKDL